MVLLNPKSPVWVRWDDRMQLGVDSDDESDSGVMKCEMNFVNPLWKMKVARPLRDDGCTPFDILIRFLGKPFEAQ
jgi:hypothetical protein